MTIQTNITASLGAISTFFSALNTYITSGGTPPDVNTVQSALVYDELLSFSQDQAQQGCSFNVGVAQEAIAINVAVDRELNMATLTKSELYDNCASDNDDEYVFYGQCADYYLGVANGSPTSGSQC